MSRLVRPVLLALVLSAVLFPSAAYAADVTEYQVQYSPVGDSTQALLIVTAVIDPGASLPATVSVPVPTGATVLWAGELLGGSPEDDPARAATMVTIGDMDVYTFTVERVRLAQVEVGLGAPPITGNRVDGTLVWTNTGPDVLVSGSIVAEPDAVEIETVPEVIGNRQINSIGETLHPVGSVRLATGESYTIQGLWQRGGAESDTGRPLLPIFLGALAVAIVALIAVVVGERKRARRRSEA